MLMEKLQAEPEVLHVNLKKPRSIMSPLNFEPGHVFEAGTLKIDNITTEYIPKHKYDELRNAFEALLSDKQK